MNPAQFIQMNELQQMELIWEKAIFIGETSSDTYKHILYNVDGLYIEETRHARYNIWCNYQCLEYKEALHRFAGQAAASGKIDS